MSQTYKVEITANICDKRIRDFVAGACGQDIQHIGTDTSFIITTGTEPTFEYLQALEKHIESMPPTDNGKSCLVYYTNVKARRIS